MERRDDIPTPVDSAPVRYAATDAPTSILEVVVYTAMVAQALLLAGLTAVAAVMVVRAFD